jgi:hypothetical protein
MTTIVAAAIHQTCWHFDTTRGEEIVACGTAGSNTISADVRAYLSGKPKGDPTTQRGWYGRALTVSDGWTLSSADGAWVGPADSEAGALAMIQALYPDCQVQQRPAIGDDRDMD